MDIHVPCVDIRLTLCRYVSMNTHNDSAESGWNVGKVPSVRIS